VPGQHLDRFEIGKRPEQVQRVGFGEPAYDLGFA
jgi:hypothetical protein